MTQKETTMIHFHGNRMARDPAKRAVMIVEFTGGQSNCYRRY